MLSDLLHGIYQGIGFSLVLLVLGVVGGYLEKRKRAKETREGLQRFSENVEAFRKAFAEELAAAPTVPFPRDPS